MMPLPPPTPPRGSDCGIPTRFASLATGMLAALGTAASFESAEAALVYTSLDFVIDPELDPIEGRIDLNGDGVADLGIMVDEASYPDVAGNEGVAFAGGLEGAALVFAGNYPAALQASDMISASMSFRPGIGTMAISSGGFLGSRGEWFSGEDAYLGARFQVDGNYFYGWVHAVWDAELGSMSIEEAAYEDSGEAAQIIEQPQEPEDFSLALGSVFDPAGGRIEWTWPVLGGETYELQRSVDLSEWRTIHTVTPSTNGEERYLDEELSEAPPLKCYYRVKRTEASASLFLLALGIPHRRKASKAS